MTPEPELEQASKPEADSRTLPTVVGEIRGWARDVFFAIGTAILIVVFLYQPVKVEGTSMLPELVDQERIFVNKFVYRIERIARKDIVVFWYPLDPSKSYIKRVIGMPGDVVEVRRGIVYVNDKELDEAYIDPEYKDHRALIRPCTSSPVITTFSATIETSPTTAACGALCRRSTSTAKPFSDTGQ